MPISGGKYVAPTWNNNSPPAINAQELQAICDVLEASQGGSVINFNEFYNNPAPAWVTLTPLSMPRNGFKVTNAGNYFLVGGGNSNINTVDAYDSTLTKVTNPDPFTTYRYSYGAAYAGNYAIFAGGNSTSGQVNTLEIYDNTLSKISTSVDPLQSSRNMMPSASFNGYAIFGGGNVSSTYRDVDCYSSGLVHQTLEDTISYGYQASAGVVGQYAIFGATTYSSSNPTSVTVYNESLTQTPADNFSAQKRAYKAVNTGDYILFGPGSYTAGGSTTLVNNVVDIYNSSLVHTTSQFPQTINDPSVYGTSTNLYGILAGRNSGTIITVSYDSSLTTNTISSLSTSITLNSDCTGTTINGNGVILQPGTSSSSANLVFAYTDNTSYSIIIPRFSAYLLNGINESEAYTATDIPISRAGTLTGYIKRGGFDLNGYHPDFVI